MKPTFEQKKRMLFRQMIFHSCVGHPAAAILSIVGLKKAAESIHWWTLPPRNRRRLKRSQVTFIHDKRMFWLDFFWLGAWSIPRGFGMYDLSERIFATAPWKTAMELETCAQPSNLTPWEK